MNLRRAPSFWEFNTEGEDYDLVVIGAGITGQSIAYFYKIRYPESRVLLLERGVLPAGASTRNAGFACIGTVGEHLADRKIESEDKVRTRIATRLKGLELLLHTLGEEAIDFEPVGGYEVFTSKQDYAQAAEHLDEINAWMKDITGKSDFYLADRYNGYQVIRNEYEGVLHPGKMIRSFTKRNLDLGVEIRWNTPVTSVDEYTKTTYSKEIPISKSNFLVIAANAFSGELVNDIDIRPARGQVFITSRLSSLDWVGSFHFEKGYVYFRHLGTDRMLIGGGRHIDPETETTNEFGINPDIRSSLINFTNEVLKLPAEWNIEQEWSGIMGFTPNKSPLMHEVSPGIWVAAGLSGMGIAISSALGKELVTHL